MNQVGIALIWCVLQVTVLGAIAVGLYVILRRMGPRAGSLVALTSLTLIVALSVLTFCPWPHWSLLAREPSSEPTETGARMETAPPAAEGTAGLPSSEQATTDAPDGLEEPSATQPAADATAFWQALRDELSQPAATSPRGTWRWPAAVAVLFLLAVGLGAARLLAGMLAVRAARRRSKPVQDAGLLELVEVLQAELGCRRKLEVRQSDSLMTAATFGWQRPLILLPSAWTDWTPQERRAVLAHEIAHVRRNDFLANLWGQLGLALHFYHPLVHWLVRRLRLEQELGADAVAASLCGDRRLYLRTITEMALRQADRPVAWPARMFLPTRTTFLRRIAMLRDSEPRSTALTARARLLAVGLLLCCGVLVAGLRGPGNDQAAQADSAATAGADDRQASAATEGSTAAEGPIDLTYVPDDLLGLLVIRPGAAAESPEQKELLSLLLEGWLSAGQTNLGDLGLSVDQIEQATWAMLPPSAGGPAGRWSAAVRGTLILRAVAPDDFRKLIDSWARGATPQKHQGQTYYKGSDGRREICYLRPDDRTIVVDREPNLRQFIESEKGGTPKLAKAEGWKLVQRDQIVMAYDSAQYAALLGLDGRETRGITPTTAFSIGAFAPLWQETDNLMLGIGLGKRLEVHVAASCKTEESTGRVVETIEAARVLARNMMQQMRAQWAEAKGSEREDAEELASRLTEMDLIDELLSKGRVEQEGRLVRAETALELDAKLLEQGVEAIRSAREAARRSMAAINLKQIALAMHNYHDVNKRLPPAASYDQEGKPLLSWRVHILPYLDQEQLYQQFHLDEPWDSPHNRQLLSSMPASYRSPKDPADATDTCYFALVGPETVFSGKEGTGFRDVRDGTANTLLVVEAKRSIPWTKPEDIAYDPEKPIPEVGGVFRGGFNASLCDGTVRFLPESINEALFRALITKAGGEPEDLRQL